MEWLNDNAMSIKFFSPCETERKRGGQGGRERIERENHRERKEERERENICYLRRKLARLD